MGRVQPVLLKVDVSIMVDPTIVKAVEDEGFLKRLNR
jgi:hypothetical protein